MASDRDNLLVRRSAILDELATGGVTGQWKPNTSIDGESISWADYRKGLLDELEQINKLLQQVSGPFIVRMRGRP